ncbi:MAG: DNA repair exonuclease [Bryobacterales bacterium]|nr:DNA repair exonuclease [Bryobacterales bacterium]MBV9397063.1 DNA repair exonuclease [Bryobacterales bacterium]
MKFLHTADWQVGMRATMLGEKGERARMARLESARRVIELARGEAVDFIVVAGDTFEHNGVDRIKVREVAKILGGADRPVYVTSGNHDPIMPGSVWEEPMWREWPNIHLLMNEAPVEAPGATLYPCPVSARDSSDDPTGWIHPINGSIAIGIAHGSVESPAYQQAAPVARQAAEIRGLDYLALGHFHSKALYPGSDGVVRMAYCGTHEQTAFGEQASGNALIVEIARRGAPPRIQAARTGILEWLAYRRKIEEPGQIAALATELDELSDPERTLVDCVLEGTLVGGDHDALAQLLEVVEKRFLFGRSDTSRLVPDQSGPEWIDRLPEGYLRNAAQDLLAAASANPPDPAATAALREYSRLWREVNQ